MNDKIHATEKKHWKNSNRFRQKIGQRLLQLGWNQQRLASESQVSDSEISRIMTGKSLPGLENAISLARAVDRSLDFLADDRLDADPILVPSSSPIDEQDAKILQLAREIGLSDADYILRTSRNLGPEMAIHRLLDSKPIITTPADSARPIVSPMPPATRASTG